MDIARINISAMASFMAARDGLPGPAAYWHDTRYWEGRAKAAV